MSDIRRILVILDTSPQNQTVLQAAAEVAVLLHAELSGVFIKDEALLQSAELPFAQEISLLSGTLRTLERNSLEQQLERQAKRAEQHLASMAQRHRLRYSFQVSHGEFISEILRLAKDVDVISLSRFANKFVKRGLGGLAQAMLEQSLLPLLLLGNQWQRFPIVVVYDQSEEAQKALSLARTLAKQDDELTVLVVDKLSNQKQQLSNLGKTPYRVISENDLGALEHLSEVLGAGLLLLPDSSTTRRVGITRMIQQLDIPVLIIR